MTTSTTVVTKKTDSEVGLEAEIQHLHWRWTLPWPSLWFFFRSLAPPGEAPGSAVHWRWPWYYHPLLATWAAVGLLQLPGPGAAQAGLPMNRPPSVAEKSYWPPARTEMNSRLLLLTLTAHLLSVFTMNFTINGSDIYTFLELGTCKPPCCAFGSVG